MLPHELAARMPHRDFVLFQHYANERLLPARRHEMHLAQISLLIAKTMGRAENVSLDDFLFHPVEVEEIAEADVPAFFNFNPINKRQ